MRFRWGKKVFVQWKIARISWWKSSLAKRDFSTGKLSLTAAATHDHVELTVSSYISISFIVSLSPFANNFKVANFFVRFLLFLAERKICGKTFHHQKLPWIGLPRKRNESTDIVNSCKKIINALLEIESRHNFSHSTWKLLKFSQVNKIVVRRIQI